MLIVFLRFMLPLLLMIVLFGVLVYALIYVDNKRSKRLSEKKEVDTDSVIEVVPHWKRISAFLIDAALIWTLIFMAGQFYKLLNVEKADTALYYIFHYLYIMIVFAYAFVQETIYSSTVGKLLLGLRVEQLNGDNISWQAAYVRNAFRFLNVLVLTDYIFALVRNDRRRLGDMAAGTRVV